MCFAECALTGIVFLMMRLRLWVSGRRPSEVNASHSIISKVNAISPCHLCLSVFSNVKLLFLPLLACTWTSLIQPILMRVKLCSISQKGQYMHKLFGILLYVRLPFSPVYLFSHLCQHGLLYIYFLNWVIIQY